MLNIQHTGVLGAKTIPCALFFPPAGPREFALGIHSCHYLGFGTASLDLSILGSNSKFFIAFPLFMEYHKPSCVEE
jgi:hypothetical protein